MARSQKTHLPPPEPQRNYTAKAIAALIAPITRPAFKRRAPAAATILADWPTLAGPHFATLAAPHKFAGGTLTLACSGPNAMQLQHLTPTLITRLNLALGHNLIERIRLTQTSPPTPTTPPAPSQSKNTPRPQNLPTGPLGEALANLYQGIKS